MAATAHYVRHDFWIPDGDVLRNAGHLARIPGVVVNGRFDLQSPIGSAWALHKAWSVADLVVVDDAGHDAGAVPITEALVDATDRFASR